MPRYLVERTFPDTLDVPQNDAGRTSCLNIVDGNTQHHVTWLHSYVTTDRGKTFCIYDGPDADAIHKAASTNGLPVDSVTEITVLDPYFYTGSA